MWSYSTMTRSFSLNSMGFFFPRSLLRTLYTLRLGFHTSLEVCPTRRVGGVDPCVLDLLTLKGNLGTRRTKSTRTSFRLFECTDLFNARRFTSLQNELRDAVTFFD